MMDPLAALLGLVGKMLEAKKQKFGKHYKSHTPHGIGKARANARRAMAHESRRRNRR
jgi:ribosomal protein L44E